MHAICHNTGGGLPENLPRILPDHLNAQLDQLRPWPTIFKVIRAGGPVELDEMRKTFNLGVGLIIVVKKGQAEAAVTALNNAGETAYQIGKLSSEAGERVQFINDPEGEKA